MRFSELKKILGGEIQGRDVGVEGLAPPGEGSDKVAEVWKSGPVETKSPAVVDADLEIDRASDYLVVSDLEDKFHELLAHFEEEPDFNGVDETARFGDNFDYQRPVHVGAGAVIGDDVSCGSRVRIGPGVTVGGEVHLADGVHLHPGVRIDSPAYIGSNTEIHSNTVIGADGYGYQQIEGQHVKIPQIGGVHIGDDVEIGANSTIDRATLGDTEIGSGTKIDDQVHVAHNCKVGESCLIIGKTGLAGSVNLGDGVVVSGGVTITDHVEVADRVKIAGRSGVTKDIDEPGTVVSGFPAQPHRDELRQQAMVRKLPRMYERLKELENT